MSDRRKLQEELNRINELYQEYDLDLRKSGGSMEQRQQMRDLLNTKKKQLMEELGDDLTKLNMGKELTISGAKAPVKPAKLALKKLAGVIPLMGAATAALSGDPAMAAEELAYDVAGPAGMVAEALKPETAGNVEEERQMLAERNAQRDYEKSPAARDAAAAKGETIPKLRKAIGRDRFESLTGTSLDKAELNKELESAANIAGDDEEDLKRLRQLRHFSQK